MTPGQNGPGCYLLYSNSAYLKKTQILINPTLYPGRNVHLKVSICLKKNCARQNQESGNNNALKVVEITIIRIDVASEEGEQTCARIYMHVHMHIFSLLFYYHMYSRDNETQEFCVHGDMLSSTASPKGCRRSRSDCDRWQTPSKQRNFLISMRTLRSGNWSQIKCLCSDEKRSMTWKIYSSSCKVIVKIYYIGHLIYCSGSLLQIVVKRERSFG